MVSLSLMASLVEAVRPDGRLILIGDPEQLASVEAGAVLGDLVGPATQGLRMRASAQRIAGRRHRPGGSGDRAPSATRRSATASSFSGGSIDSAVRSPSWPRPSVRATPMPRWRLLERRSGRCALAPRRHSGDAGRSRRGAKRSGGGGPPVSGTPPARARRPRPSPPSSSFRVLCAHRRGPEGATTWMANGRELAEGGDRRLRHRGEVVRRPTASGDRQRLQPPALQRRHRSGGRRPRGSSRRRIRAGTAKSSKSVPLDWPRSTPSTP